MVVTWVVPTTQPPSDRAFLETKIIPVIGSGPFKINKIRPDGDGWIISLKTLTGRAVDDEVSWLWLRPIPRPALQIGSLATWAALETIDDDVSGAEDVLVNLNSNFGMGPFTVAEQIGLLVYLVDRHGFSLNRAKPLEDQGINRCFVEPV